MEYNTTRPAISFREYGRHIQQMIQYALTIEDMEKRNLAAKTIINVMGQLNPSLRDITDFKHKLWDHLFMISDYNLDVEAPYPKPVPEILLENPERLSYPKKDMRYLHYGRSIEQFIAKANEMADCPEKEQFIIIIANLMKKAYLTWNRESVTDEIIDEQLGILSDGKLKLPKDVQLDKTSDILAKNNAKKFRSSNNNNNNRGNNGKFHHKNNNNRNQNYSNQRPKY